MSDKEWGLDDLQIDFLNDHLQYLKPQPKGGKELLNQACGSQKNIKLVWDTTLGLAEDSLFLAQAGFYVIGFERQTDIYQRLSESLKNIKAQFPIQDSHWCHRLLFFEGEFSRALKYFSDFTSELPLDWQQIVKSVDQSVYYDPMFPDKKKSSALPRKQMQIFKKIVGPDPDTAETFQILKDSLQTHAQIKRLVVKRPITAGILSERCDHSYKGRTIRYDIYSMKKR